MRLLSIFISLTLTTFAGAQSTLTVKGTIENGAGNSIFLEKLVNNKPVLADSSTINRKDKFELETSIEEMTFYRLHVRPNDFIILLANEETEKITINADLASLGTTYKVEGSKHSLYTQEFLQGGMKYVQLKDSITKQVNARNQLVRQISQQIQKKQREGASQATIDSLSAIANATNQQTREAQALLNKKSQEFITFRNDFIDEHLSSPAILTTLSYLNPQREFDYYKKVVSVAQEQMPGSFYDQQLSKQLAQLEAQQKQREEKAKKQREMAQRLAPGKEAPELEFNDPEGNPIKLSDLRGNVVLIDFWASWCGPCRRENPNVVKMYNEYKDDGFTIYSVSLDKNKERWVQAIEADNLNWENHVSDLKGWGSEAAQKYGVSGIPFTVLIDEEGKIIATRLRGPALEQKLAEIFGS